LQHLSDPFAAATSSPRGRDVDTWPAFFVRFCPAPSIRIMKNFHSGPFQIGQKLLYCSSETNKIQTVTFVSLGPRVGKTTNGLKDTVIGSSKTAIVRDRKGDLMTVKLSDLNPHPSSGN